MHDDLAGTGHYERPIDQEAYRAGHCKSGFTNTSGRATLKIPKLKGMRFVIAIIERYKRHGISAEETKMEMYLAKVSTRRIGNTSEILWRPSVSATTASNLNNNAFRKVEAWRSSELPSAHPCAFTNGIYLKRFWNDAFDNAFIIAATGV